MVNTPKWLKFIGNRNINSPEEAAAYIESKMRPQLKKLGFSNNTVIRKIDNIKMGTCGLYDRDGLNGVDIGFAFLPEFEGMGYGYEAASALLKKGLEDFGLKRILAITIHENYVSQNLLKKLGLKQIGNVTLPSDKTEFLLFEITQP